MSRFTLALSVLLSATLFSSFSSASLLTLEPGDKSIPPVNVAKAATANLSTGAVSLSSAGAGLRTKDVLITTVKVYVAQLLTNNPARFVRNPEGALKSFEDVDTVAMRLTFLRNVPADKVQVSFRDSLMVNQVNLKDPAIQTLLNAVTAGGDAQNGKSMTFLLHKKSDGSESLYFEDTNDKITVIEGAKGLSQSLMSIWFGKMTDKGLTKLRDQILSWN
jgi:hypothetical protein